jgi:hypothetical protein
MICGFPHLFPFSFNCSLGKPINRLWSYVTIDFLCDCLFFCYRLFQTIAREGLCWEQIPCEDASKSLSNVFACGPNLVLWVCWSRAHSALLELLAERREWSGKESEVSQCIPKTNRCYNQSLKVSDDGVIHCVGVSIIHDFTPKVETSSTRWQSSVLSSHR